MDSLSEYGRLWEGDSHNGNIETKPNAESASVTPTAPAVEEDKTQEVHPSAVHDQSRSQPEVLDEDHSVPGHINERNDNSTVTTEKGDADADANPVTGSNPEEPPVTSTHGSEHIKSPTQHSITDNKSIILNWIGNVDSDSEEPSAPRADDQDQKQPISASEREHEHPHDDDHNFMSENGTSNESSTFVNDTETTNSDTLATSRTFPQQVSTQPSSVTAVETLSEPLSPALSTASSDSASTVFYDCEEALPQSNDDDNDDGSPAGYENYAPTADFWLGREGHERAHQHVQRAVEYKKMGPNGPHGPSREPYKTDPQTLALLRDFDGIRAKHSITILLVNVLLYIVNRKYSNAESEVEKALDIAKELNQEPTLARCYYWLGVIEYNRGNNEKALSYFQDARPCVDEYPVEGKDLGMYLSLLQRGIGREQRKNILLSNGKTILTGNGKAALPRRKHFTEFANEHLKRKRSSALPPVETVLRMTAQRKRNTNGGHKKKDPKKKDTTTTTTPRVRPTVWLKHDTKDIEDRSSLRRDEVDHRQFVLGTQVQDADLEFLKKVPFSDDIDDDLHRQGPFNFNVQPKGLAPRTRTTKTFSELPCEIIMSSDKWASIQETVGDKEVTMSLLRKEQEKLSRWSQMKMQQAKEQSTVVGETKEQKGVSEPAKAPERNGESVVEPTETSEADSEQSRIVLEPTSTPGNGDEQSNESIPEATETPENNDQQSESHEGVSERTNPSENATRTLEADNKQSPVTSEPTSTPQNDGEPSSKSMLEATETPENDHKEQSQGHEVESKPTGHPGNGEAQNPKDITEPTKTPEDDGEVKVQPKGE